MWWVLISARLQVCSLRFQEKLVEITAGTVAGAKCIWKRDILQFRCPNGVWELLIGVDFAKHLPEAIKLATFVAENGQRRVLAR